MVERLPSVDRYLERLPRGLSSHPECQVKASVYRDALASHGLESVISELPRELRELVLEPPPVSSWVPEVYANSIMMAIRDVHFEPGTVGVTAYSEWTRERNLLLLTRPLYRALFLLLSPERLLKGLQRRWGAFRKGTTIELVHQGVGAVELRVRYPENLYEETTLSGLRGALVAALEAAGAGHVKVELIEFDDRQASYRGSWS